MSLQLYLNHKNILVDPQLTAISGYNSGIPIKVMERIHQLNLQKKPDAPVLLVLRAAYDTSGNFLSSIPKLSQFANFALSSRVFIQTITDKSQIQPMVSAAKKGGKICAVIFSTHADDEFLQLSDENIYSVEDISESDFEDTPEDAPIILDACNTGLKFAAVLSKKVNRVVLGAMGNIVCFSRFYFCPHHRFYEIVSPTTTPFAIFNPDGTQTNPCAQFSEKIPEFCAILENYFTDWEPAKDYYYYMGMLYDCKRDYIKALQWFLKGTNENEAQSQTMVGLFYAQGRGIPANKEVAFQWYLKAAAQKDLDAQFAIGTFFEEGLGGQLKNIPLAILWYKQAATLGSPKALEALHRLGALPANPMVAPTTEPSTAVGCDISLSSSSSSSSLPSASADVVISDPKGTKRPREQDPLTDSEPTKRTCLENPDDDL